MNRLAALALVAAILTACGGGGGGSGGNTIGSGGLPPSTSGSVVFTATPPAINVASIQRNTEMFLLVTTIEATVSPTTPLYLGVGDPADLLASVLVYPPTGATVPFQLTFRNNLPVGLNRGDLVIEVCFDDRCQRPLSGSPLRVPMAMDVLPNIEAPALITLSRTGNAPAPTVVVPLSVPAAAGAVIAGADGGSIASVRVEGNNVILQAQPVRSGVYEGTLIIQSDINSRYFKTTRIRHEVLPPPGGERNWNVVATEKYTLREGERLTTTILAEPPTWAVSPVTIENYGPSPWMSVAPLGDNRHALTLDATGLVAGDYVSGYLRFRAGDFAEVRELWIQVSIEPAFEVLPPAVVLLNRSTTPGELAVPVTVRMLQPPEQRWTASVNASWLRPRATSGLTGADLLTLDIDPVFFEPNLFGSKAYASEVPEVTVSVNRAGTRPAVVPLTVRREFNALMHVLPHQLVAGEPGRVYVVGEFQTDVLSSGALQLRGARVVSSALVNDPYDSLRDLYFMVRLDLDDLVAGVPVTVALDAGLASRTFSIPVLARASLPTTEVSLPAATRSAPVYSQKQQSLYWLEPDRIHALRLDAGRWIEQSVGIAGLLGFDLSADELRLIAFTPESAPEFDGRSLALAETAAVATDLVQRLWGTPASRAMVVTLDGVPWAWTQHPLAPGRITLRRLVPDGPGVRRAFGLAHLPNPDLAGLDAGTLRSADRATLLQVATYGTEFIGSGYAYGDTGPVWPFSLFAQPVRPVAVTRDGRQLDAQGGLRESKGQRSAAVSGLISASRPARGLAISADGRRVYAYVSRVEAQAGGVIETDAAVLVIELAGTGEALTARVAQTITLAQPLNCRTPSSIADCERRVEVAVDANDLNAFVLGRQGMAVVASPGPVASGAAPPPIRSFAIRN